MISRCPVDLLTRFTEIYAESPMREELLGPIIEFIHNLVDLNLYNRKQLMICRSPIFDAYESSDSFQKETALYTLEKLTNASAPNANLLILSHKSSLLTKLVQDLVSLIQSSDLDQTKRTLAVIGNYAQD